MFERNVKYYFGHVENQSDREIGCWAAVKYIMLIGINIDEQQLDVCIIIIRHLAYPLLESFIVWLNHLLDMMQLNTCDNRNII